MPRSMSEAQEAAQLLAGTELPRIVLEPLFHGVEFSGSVGGVVNFTPYDAFLEKVRVKWQLTLGMDHLALKTLSISPNTEAVAFSERIMANELLQDMMVENTFNCELLFSKNWFPVLDVFSKHDEPNIIIIYEQNKYHSNKR